ncbi:MAG: MATE family efflux transporter [Oscillospiraceae bacterium]
MFFTRDKGFYKSFFHLLIVVALQNVVAYSVNMADNIMLGSYSQTALSGAAAVNQIQFLVQQATIAIGDGMIMLNAQYWGKRELSPIRSVTGVALKGGLVFGVGMLALAALFPTAIVGIFTSDRQIIEAGVEYLSILKYTYLFYILTTILMAALRSVETVNISFGVSLMSLLVNVCVNYALIFGHFGFPEMGIKGAAVSTLIARILEFCVVLFYVLKVDRKLCLFSENPFRRRKDLEADYWRVAAPVVCTNLLWSIATPIQTAILGRLSTDAIAANSVSTTVFQYLKVVTVSEASSTSVVIGRAIGSGKRTPDALRPYVRTIQAISLLLGIVLGGVLLAARRPLLSLYALTPDALALADQLIVLMAFIFVGMAYQMPAASGIIRGSGDIKFSMYTNLISTWGIVMPLSFAAAFWWKLPVFWVVLILNSDQIFKCIPIAIRTNSYKWIHVLTRD